MAADVTSHNQQGGITAGRVDIGGTFPSDEEKPPKRRWPQWLMVIGGIASVVTILTYLGIAPNSSENSMSENGVRFQVTSHNQQGGITAGEVKIERPPPRTLNDQGRAALLQNLPKDKPVDIQALMNDIEALQFAHQIKTFLVSDGYDAKIQQAMFQGPVVGQSIESSGSLRGGFRVVIGSQQ